MSGLDYERLHRATAHANKKLLAAIGPDGHWVGELSSSALSTATAVTALALVQREIGVSSPSPWIETGLHWLARHQNTDGGWGDTVLSLSNLSTTALCWAAFGSVRGADEKYREAVTRAETWLKQHAGGIAPDQLAPAVIARYGKDRTFSVPILTMCALAGRLGTGRDAWKHVIPLPFELAACPHSWFAALRLPVVSYALPALIAIGQVRHNQSPSRNPIARLIRNATRGSTLRKLERIQPENGGFLEATPLTSFVTMSLAGSGQANHPVTKRGVEFLVTSQRTDGSWPIDTNLATWVTTLAVNALNGGTGFQPVPTARMLSSPEAAVDDPARPDAIGTGRKPALRWLLNQQYRSVHPYTHAAPGGWAWTDLPGGVPDADDTAGALLAIRHLGPIDDETRAAAAAGVTWLLDLQNRDGGIPTFCRGWGALPFDQSSADITAHTIRAWLAWKTELPALETRIDKALRRANGFLAQQQRPDGSWVPLWFGNQRNEHDENPVYGTARVVTALGLLPYSEMLNSGVGWLIKAQSPDGGWGTATGERPTVEETAVAVEALAASLDAMAVSEWVETVEAAMLKGVNWLLARVESGEWTQLSPIGFYFAKLWYYEQLYPMIFTVGALNKVERALRPKS